MCVGLEVAHCPLFPSKKRMARNRAISAISLIEIMVAVAILGIAAVGMMSGISYMRFENRAASQRMLVASIGTQILELFKALPYASIANSGTAGTIYLEGYGTASPNLAWQVPTASGTGMWQPLPVEDVNSNSASNPAIIANKIPGPLTVSGSPINQGEWSVQIASPSTGLKQITVTINWLLYAGSTRPPETFSISTVVSSAIPNL